MKHLTLTLLALLVSGSLLADPIPYVDDWHLLKYIKDYELEDRDSDMRLTSYNQKLFLYKGDQKETVFDFTKDKYEVHLVTGENNKKTIYVFNDSKKKLFKADADNSDVKFEEVPWKFGSLKAIFKNCDDSKENFGYEIGPNHFLTKFKYSERPEALQCKYLIAGGRCYLIYDPKTNEYEVGDKMILSDNLKYARDINSIGFAVFSGCSLYSKLIINK